MRRIGISVKQVFLGACCLLCSQHLSAQHTGDSTKHILPHLPAWSKPFIIPSLLAGAGMLTKSDESEFNLEVREERDEHMPRFRTHVDDYLQYAPIVAVYSLNGVGVKSKNDFANRTVLLIKSELIMTALVYPLKKIVAEPRPDTGTPNSFPSGHTAQAFAAATFLHKEYGKEHPLYSVLAYTTATGIGVLRVLNNRHWVADVAVGAGIGVLSTNVAYLTHQYKWGKHRRHAADITMLPMYGQGAMGFYLAMPIR